MFTREKAYEIAVTHLGEQVRGQIKVTEALPRNIYCRERLLDSWVVRVPQKSPVLTIGLGRIICISKKIGEIVYDGSDGGE